MSPCGRLFGYWSGGAGRLNGCAAYKNSYSCTFLVLLLYEYCTSMKRKLPRQLHIIQYVVHLKSFAEDEFVGSHWVAVALDVFVERLALWELAHWTHARLRPLEVVARLCAAQHRVEHVLNRFVPLALEEREPSRRQVLLKSEQ